MGRGLRIDCVDCVLRFYEDISMKKEKKQKLIKNIINVIIGAAVFAVVIILREMYSIMPDEKYDIIVCLLIYGIYCVISYPVNCFLDRKKFKKGR